MKNLKVKEYDPRGKGYDKTSFFDIQEGMIVDIKASSLALSVTQLQEFANKRMRRKKKNQNEDSQPATVERVKGAAKDMLKK